MTKEQYTKWTEFRENKTSRLSSEEFEFLCRLHADLFNHQYYKPCTCSPREINRWIQQINKRYNELFMNDLQ